VRTLSHFINILLFIAFYKIVHLVAEYERGLVHEYPSFFMLNLICFLLALKDCFFYVLKSFHKEQCYCKGL
jgi:hypothetical protein